MSGNVTPDSDSGPPPRFQRQDPMIERLRKDLEVLRIPRRLSGRLRVALRRRHELRRTGRNAIALLWVLAAICVYWLLLFWAFGGVDMAEFGPFVLFTWAVLSLFGFMTGWRTWCALAVIRRYALVTQVADAISACANAVQAGGERAAPELRLAGNHLARVARSLERAHRRRGTVPRRSHRNNNLKVHERLVIGALRKAEARLDTSPAEGLRDVAGLLLTIAERYSHSQIGALLDEQDLQDIEQMRDYSMLRWLAAVILGTVAVVGVSLLNLPSTIEPYAISGILLITIGAISGPSARRAIDVIEVIRTSGQ